MGILKGERNMPKEHSFANNAMSDFPRITRDLAVMGGKPCIRGMRVTVGMIVGQIGAGLSIEELLRDYPYIQRGDVVEAINYAGLIAASSKSPFCEP
jgi:uncharacterized protein (DUF433 family)